MSFNFKLSFFYKELQHEYHGAQCEHYDEKSRVRAGCGLNGSAHQGS